MRVSRHWFAVLALSALAACGPPLELDEEDWLHEPDAEPEQTLDPGAEAVLPPATSDAPDELVPSAGASLSVHTSLGVPDTSSTSASNSNRYLSVKSTYVVSYNSSKKVPNWVSWELSKKWLGTVDRTDNYRSDDTLPSSLAQAANADYSGSGFDRGHLCPSADRADTRADNSSTFYLSNMVPQAGNNNRGPWAKLETYSRTLAKSGKRLFVVAGGIFGSKATKVGSGVAVPDDTFKVIVVLDSGQGVKAVSDKTRVIAVKIPNSNATVSTSADWKRYRTSARELETLTGLNFLSDVPQSVQDVIETRVDSL